MTMISVSSVCTKECLYLPCEVGNISVVDRTASDGDSRPLELIRCEAKSVLISVDLPKPVWPRQKGELLGAHRDDTFVPTQMTLN